MTAFLINSHFGASLRSSLSVEKPYHTDLFLYCQPQMNLANNHVVGYECLLRWFSKEHGYIQPEHCLRIAEIYGLNDTLLKWSICETIGFIKNTHDVYFAVNICPTELTHAVAQFILENIQSSGIDAKRFHIELTEHKKITNIKELVATVAWLRRHGVKVSLDDFGSGHADLRCVVRLDLDLIKIDRSLVSGIHQSKDKRLDLMGTLGILHELEVPLLCEGVEHAEEEKILKDFGVHFGQGYFYGKPINFHDIPHNNSDNKNNILYFNPQKQYS